MNENHAADSLLIVRALGGRPEAVAVRMTGLDAGAIEFAARAGGDRERGGVRIPFARRLTERAEVRQEVIRMYRAARAHSKVRPIRTRPGRSLLVSTRQSI